MQFHPSRWLRILRSINHCSFCCCLSLLRISFGFNRIHGISAFKPQRFFEHLLTPDFNSSLPPPPFQTFSYPNTASFFIKNTTDLIILNINIQSIRVFYCILRPRCKFVSLHSPTLTHDFAPQCYNHKRLLLEPLLSVGFFSPKVVFLCDKQNKCRFLQTTGTA